MGVITIQQVATDVLEKWIKLAEHVVACAGAPQAWPEHLAIPADYQERIDEAKAELRRRA
jgi:hypothetical protein